MALRDLDDWMGITDYTIVVTSCIYLIYANHVTVHNNSFILICIIYVNCFFADC